MNRVAFSCVDSVCNGIAIGFTGAILYTGLRKLVEKLNETWRTK